MNTHQHKANRILTHTKQSDAHTAAKTKNHANSKYSKQPNPPQPCKPAIPPKLRNNTAKRNHSLTTYPIQPNCNPPRRTNPEPQTKPKIQIRQLKSTNATLVHTSKPIKIKSN